jgi:hypothetical protein
MARRRYYFSDKLAARKSRRTKICVLALLLIAVSATSAWSNEFRSSGGLFGPAVVASQALPLSTTENVPSPAPIHPSNTPDPVVDEIQRPAGQPAVSS